MIRQHVLKDSDTLQHLSTKYYGTPEKWKDIVEYNNLDYPYITKDQQFKTEIPASGKVTFSVSDLRPYDIPIPEGTLVTNEEGDRMYVTDTAVTLYAGSFSADAQVTCLVPGFWGNIPAGRITKINIKELIKYGTFLYNQGIYGEVNSYYLTDPLKVTNKLAFFNGVVYNVKKTGQTILIPIDEPLRPVNLQNRDYLEILGRRDILLTDEGDFEADVYGDLSTVSGVKNIEYSIKRRLQTPKGSVLRHPNYGSKLHQLSGRREPFINKLIELEIMETVLSDDRVEGVSVTNIRKQGAGLFIECDIKLPGIQNPQAVRFFIS